MVLLSLFLSWRHTLFTHSTNNLAIRPTQLIFLRFYQIQNGFTFHFPPLDAKAITQFTQCTCPTQLILLRLTHSKWFYFTFPSLGGVIRYSHTLHRVRTMCFGCIWVIIRKREMALLAIKGTPSQDVLHLLQTMIRTLTIGQDDSFSQRSINFCQRYADSAAAILQKLKQPDYSSATIICSISPPSNRGTNLWRELNNFALQLLAKCLGEDKIISSTWPGSRTLTKKWVQNWDIR